MSYLVDTNVLGELARRRPEEKVRAWAASVSRVLLSVVTMEELVFGLSWKPNARVIAWLDDFLRDDCEVIEITETIARRAGQLRGQLMAIGQPRSQADMLIAATASVHGLTVATRNVVDFEGCGISVFDPFA